MRALPIALLLAAWFPGNTCVAQVGIVVALESTKQELSKYLSEIERSELANREFVKGFYQDIDIVLIRSPMGKVNNAITTQALLSNYSIDLLISVSPAGALSEEVNIGDIVVANGLYHHDFGTIKPYGFISQNTPKGINWPLEEYTAVNGRFFEFVERAVNNTKVEHHQGVVATGDQFISSKDKKEWIRKKYNAIAVDMGAAAIGQVCQQYRKPLIVLRVITDRADLIARVNFGAWRNPYGSQNQLAEIVINLVDRISNSKGGRDEISQ